MGIAQEMEDRLRAAFDPVELVIVDDSESHRGHAGYQDGGESHWQVTIRSAAFEGQSRIARHRAVHTALGADIVGRIHALQLTLSTP